MKKLLNLLTIAIVSTTSVSSTTAFIPKNKNIYQKNISNNTNLNNNSNKNISNNFFKQNSAINKNHYLNNKKISDHYIFNNINNSSSFQGIDEGIINFNNKIYISDRNGIYYLNNEQKQWIKISNISADFNWSGIIFKSSFYCFDQISDKLYKSTDGIKFESINVPFHSVYSTVIFNSNLYLGTQKGLYSTTDGINYKLISLGQSNEFAIDLKNINNNLYLVSNLENLYKSTDGLNFSNLNINKKIIGFLDNVFIYNNILFLNQQGSNSYTSTDDGKTLNQTNFNIDTYWIINNILFFNTLDGIYKSTDGKTFQKVNFQGVIIPPYSHIKGMIEVNNDILLTTSTNIYKSLPIADYKNFINCSTPIKKGIINNLKEYHLFYNSNQTINFIDNTLVKTYKFKKPNGSLTPYAPNDNINLNPKIDGGYQYQIEITLNNKADAINYPFGDINNGIITVYINIINQDYFNANSKLIYSTTPGNVNLYQGLIGNQGNINGEEIVGTKTKTGSGNAPLNIDIYNIDYIDWTKSNYQKGTLDSGGINFTKDSSSSVSLPQNGISNLANGIYQTTITDLFGHSKKIIWEVGSLNAKGQLDPNTNQDITNLANQLKITESLTSTSDKIKSALLGKLNNYQTAINNYIKTINLNYKGFENSIDPQTKKSLRDSISDYEKQIQNQFLDSLNAINPDDPSTILFSTTTSKTNQKTIEEAVNDFKTNKFNSQTFSEAIQSDLNSLIQRQIEGEIQKNQNLWKKLNIKINYNFFNDPNAKQDLDKFNQYVVDYNNYINNNFNTWLQKDINNDGLGYLTEKNIANIKNKYTIEYFESQFLKTINWTPKTLSASSFDNNIDFMKFNTSVANYIDTTFNVKGQLQTDIANAEKGVNLYNHKINDILKYKNKQLPKNKTKISNFDGKGTTFHNWLIKASKDYNTYITNKNNTKNTNHTILIATLTSVSGVGLILLFYFLYKYRWSKKARGLLSKSEVLKLHKEGYDVEKIIKEQHPELKHLLEDKDESKK